MVPKISDGSLQSCRVWESVGKIRACKIVVLTNEVECYAVDNPEQTMLDFTNLSSRCIMMCWLHYWEGWATVSSQMSPHIKNIITQTSWPIINSFGTNSKDDLTESVLITPTPSKPSHSAAVEMRKLYNLNLCLQFCFEKNDFSCLKMSPPKSCVSFRVWTYIWVS